METVALPTYRSNKFSRIEQLVKVVESLKKQIEEANKSFLAREANLREEYEKKIEMYKVLVAQSKVNIMEIPEIPVITKKPEENQVAAVQEKWKFAQIELDEILRSLKEKMEGLNSEIEIEKAGARRMFNSRPYRV
jgi:hypothetical protein